MNTQVRFKQDIININNKTLHKLDEELMAAIDSNKITLLIPPKSTVFLSDLINSANLFEDKILIIHHADNIDTINFNYPYKKLKVIKRKRDSAYNYFYKTIISYDIE